MILSDTAIRRPVLAIVVNLLLVVFGLIAFARLSLREYPDIDPPVVSIQTDYPGANAAIVETQVTQPIEDRVRGIEGIRWIQSSSSDGRSSITVEFAVGRDIDAAANDVREAVARVTGRLPEGADPPQVTKADASADVVLWLNLAGEGMDRMQITDFAERYLVDRFAVLEGVAQVRIGGAKRPALRIRIDREALAARGLTPGDIETVLRRENVELPAGRIESVEREFNVRVARAYRTPEDFAALVLAHGADGHLVRLGEVARVEIAPADERSELRGNGVDMVGIGIVQQSTANLLDVARAVKREAERINQTLPEGMRLHTSFDASVFIDGAVREVFQTLLIVAGVVVLVIWAFLGSLRAMLIPAVTVPISLVASFIVLYALGFSVNLLTLLALILAIGLVVDDAIVVLENIHRRIGQGEPPLLAAFRGTRQVAFAVIATTLVLIAVFVPLAFLQGAFGKLFTEFALAMAAAVVFSSLVALTLTPVMCAKLLRHGGGSAPARAMAGGLERLEPAYGRLLERLLDRPALVGAALLAVLAAAILLYRAVPGEYAPREDRGVFYVMATAPEGTGYEAMQGYMREVERRLLPLVERGEAIRVLARTPRGFGASDVVNNGIAVVVLEHWNKRQRSAWAIMDEVNESMSDLPGVRVVTIMRQGISGRRVGQPVQFVIGGGSYEELAGWRDIVLDAVGKNPGLVGADSDLKETRPQIVLTIDRDRAGDLGVPMEAIGHTLETVLGTRRVSSFSDRGEEYDVLLEGERGQRRAPADIANVHVRSATTGALITLANLVTLREQAGPASLNRYNRMRAVTLSASLAEGHTLGEALAFLEGVVAAELPPTARIDYKGESLEFRQAGGAVNFVFVLALLVVFLVLAAQFESFIHPFVILSTVPLAVAGALFGLWATGQSLNLYSQIGLVMLVGLAAKNGILIVEFANQLRDAGQHCRDAILTAARIRLRPVLMTSLTTVIGALPLILASGPGRESRVAIGIVVFAGVLFATLLTLVVVPVAWRLVAGFTGAPGDVARRLAAEEDDRGAGQA